MNDPREPQVPNPEDRRADQIPTIATGEPIPRSRSVPVSETTVGPSAGRKGTDADQSLETEWAFLLNEQRYISEYIRFADQKSAFVFAFALGTLGLLFGQHAFDGFASDPLLWIRNEMVYGMAAGLLILSSALSIAAILPRLWASEPKGLVYWDGVAKFQSPTQYFEALRAVRRDALHRELADHCFNLARICSRKYALVRYAIWAAPIGAVLGIARIVVGSEG